MGFAQEDGEPVVWTATLNRVSESLVEIQFDAVIKDKWHLYTLKEFKAKAKACAVKHCWPNSSDDIMVRLH